MPASRAPFHWSKPVSPFGATIPGRKPLSTCTLPAAALASGTDHPRLTKPCTKAWGSIAPVRPRAPGGDVGGAHGVMGAGAGATATTAGTGGVGGASGAAAAGAAGAPVSSNAGDG